MCTTPIDYFFNLEETVMMTRWLQQRGLIRQFPQPADKRLNWHHLPTNQPPQANPRNTLLLNQVPSGWGDQRSTYDIEDNKTQKIIVWPECQPSQRLLRTFVLARNCHGESAQSHWWSLIKLSFNLFSFKWIANMLFLVSPYCRKAVISYFCKSFITTSYSSV